jgi:fibronectin-binding autotransporter adhesin
MKKKNHFVILALFMTGASATQAADGIIRPTGVILENQRPNSSSPGPYLQYGSPLGLFWYNGSGLSNDLPTGDPVPLTWPTHAAYSPTIISRVRDTGEIPASPAGEASLVFNLGGSFLLKGIALWNSNESGSSTGGNNTLRGVENMTLSYSTDGGTTFTPGETLSTWTEGSVGEIAPEIRMLTTSVPNVTHLRIVADNFNADPILTFCEIRMITEIPPLLKWASGSANWTATDVWENESVVPDTFVDGDNVKFEDLKSGASPITVTLDSTVSPQSVIFEHTDKAYTVSGSGKISGTTSLIKSGTGTLTLATANDYSGGTTLNAGQLNLNNASAIGTGTFTIAGGTIDNTSGGAIVNAGANPMTWNAGISFVGTNDLDLGTGAVTLGGPRTVDVQANTLTVGGAIDGAFALTKTGTGTLALTGTNTYTGNTTVNAGVLELNSGDAIANTGRLTIDGSGSVELTQNETVTLLYFGSVPKLAGTYGRLGLAGVDFNDARFTGDGVLTVTSVGVPEVLFWDTSTTAGFQKASGNWNLTDTNWSPDGTDLFAWNPAIAANFSSDDTTATVTVTEDLGAAGLNFLNSGYTIAGNDPARTITLSGGNINLADGTTNTIGANLNIVRNNVIRIGQANDTASGSLNILAGATIERSANNQNLEIEGINTQVSVSGSLRVTSGFGQFNLGSNKTSGTDVSLTIEGNGLVATDSDPAGTVQNNVIQIGFAASSVTDPSLVVGTVTMKDNAVLRSGTGGDRGLRLGQYGTGTLNMEGNALVQASVVALGNGGNGTGILNFNGGTIETGSLFFNKPNSTADFNGGTLKVIGNTDPIIRAGSGAAFIGDNGLTVNTNGFDTSATEDLQSGGTGGLTKTGLGTLLLTGANSYDGITTVSAGSLTIEDTAAIPDLTEVTVAAGAGFGGIVGPANLLDADIQTILNSVNWTSGSFLVIDTNGADVTVAANITGNIGLIKKGAGVLTLTGTNNYTGPTIVQGGSIAGIETTITNVSIVKAGNNATLTFTASGLVDVYRSTDLVNWGTAYATNQSSPYTDTAASGPKFFYVLVPAGATYPPAQ